MCLGYCALQPGVHCSSLHTDVRALRTGKFSDNCLLEGLAGWHYGFGEG